MNTSDRSVLLYKHKNKIKSDLKVLIEEKNNRLGEVTFRYPKECSVYIMYSDVYKSNG